MNTPICDFVNKYTKSVPLRLHMPGHKGVDFLGFEKYDITEINGADSLFEASGIIRESEANASGLFEAHTFYSCEGSSLSIRAMLYLALLWGKKCGRSPVIFAGRNAHKSFLTAAAFLDIDVFWLTDTKSTYLSCDITAEGLESALKNSNSLPCAIYITSPDYLGNITDICKLAQICNKYDVLLLVDNAHGAYLKFLGMHPLELGADMVCDSAHKTLPALTGGAYLHISKSAPEFLAENAKTALSLFASTSPSYLILQSLDRLNAYLTGHKQRLLEFIPHVEAVKADLKNAGFILWGNEPLKLTIKTKPYGYTGYQLQRLLEKKNIFAEYADPDHIVFMLTPEIGQNGILALNTALISIKKQPALTEVPPAFSLPPKAVSIREALLSPRQEVDTAHALNRICAAPTVSCPPAVPIVACGEIIDENAVKCLNYYGITRVKITL